MAGGGSGGGGGRGSSEAGFSNKKLSLRLLTGFCGSLAGVCLMRSYASSLCIDSWDNETASRLGLRGLDLEDQGGGGSKGLELSRLHYCTL